MTDGQLAGVRVLDLGTWRPVPYATALLSELGADVVKVEPPGGDPMRAFPELFELLNLHKRSVLLNLHAEDDRAAALALAREADIVVEGFRPGVASRLGVGPDEVHAVNAAAVFCHVSGFGQTGGREHEPGHDINYQAVSGVLAELGVRTPTLPLADLAGGLAAAFAMAAALVRSRRTGLGEVIDVSMADVLATWVGPVDRPQLTGVETTSSGAAGYGVFDTADGSIALGIVTEDRFWSALCRWLGRDDLAGRDVASRFRDSTELNDELARALARHPRAEVLAGLAAAGVPASPVLSRAEMLGEPALQERGTVTGGRLGHPVLFREAPALPPTGQPAPPAALPAWLPR